MTNMTGKPVSSSEVSLTRERGRTTPSPLAFSAAIILTFLAAVAISARLEKSMSSMQEMRMPGGWSMSMTWMIRPGENFIVALLRFLRMWVPMTVAMMLPSIAPTLWKFRQGLLIELTERNARLVTLAGLGYFCGWTLFGSAIFPLAVALGAAGMSSPNFALAVPAAGGMLVVIAGCLQFTRMKRLHLHCCKQFVREEPWLPNNAKTAVRFGFRLGVRCIQCCLSFTLVMLVVGMMNLRSVGILTAAITFERLAQNEQMAARMLGLIAIAFGVFITLQASFR